MEDSLLAKRIERLNSRAGRGGASWVVRAGCIYALAGCAGSQTAQHASATPNSGEGSDGTPGASDGTHEDPSHDARPAPATSALELDVPPPQTLSEAETDVRDRDMREAVEGPQTARGRAADNSAQNERDRIGNTATPFEPDNPARDLELTTSIRRAIASDSALSFNAKNLKIVAEDGEVTLRGPVNSADEKARVESLARAAGADRVISLIEVEP